MISKQNKGATSYHLNSTLVLFKPHSNSRTNIAVM